VINAARLASVEICVGKASTLTFHRQAPGVRS
jgi:hypothetical protein